MTISCFLPAKMNEDDVVVMAHVIIILSAVAALALRPRRRRRWHVRPINLERPEQGDFINLFRKIKANDPDQFFSYTRMVNTEFDHLLCLVRKRLLKRSHRKFITPEERLALTLKFLAHGGSMQSLAWEYRMGKSTVCNILKETCNVIWDILSEKYVSIPDENKWKQIACEYMAKWNMPLCVGSIDGKHINVQCPVSSGSLYYNYKGTYSMILMAACDASYRFTLVDIGSYGYQGDRNVFANSYFGQSILDGSIGLPCETNLPGTNIQLPYYFVGDAAFPLKTNLMRPFPGKLLPLDKKVFNYRLSRARRTIENAFGILSSRWRVLRNTIVAYPDTVDAIVKATICLHNFLSKSDSYCPANYVDQEDNVGNIIPGQWRQYEGPTFLDVNQTGSNRAGKDAIQIRETLKQYLVTPAGEVPWQIAYVNRNLDRVAVIEQC